MQSNIWCSLRSISKTVIFHHDPSRHLNNITKSQERPKKYEEKMMQSQCPSAKRNIPQ
ncbi:Uncharacterized protein BM_BM14276 [Brugia malayi]|uniref:Bm14276 n=1 Tax=Brugia malayi TaxID=6279 RepID=A0A0J9Y1C1_BRUMA|nr:Uncharacterized protein BM_BM14276 [Brugia malayi]CDQ00181.1 Bm14276 [Brugia malayi]VIO91027.1 Uncharacterized protein BM_BM14276 [Brugia malayi]